MSAAESTNKSQFGFVEVTRHTQTPADEKSGQAAGTHISTRLNYVDKSKTTTPTDPLGYAQAESHATASASFRHISPRLYTETEKKFGEDEEHLLNEKGMLTGDAQGMLFDPGETEGPTIDALSSTRQGRFANVRAVGMLADMMKRRTGHDVGPVSDLSGQSAPMVSKLTGVEHEQTNTIGFQSEPFDVSLPDPNSSGQRLLPANPIDQSVTRVTHRLVSDEEAKAGGKLIGDRMRSMRIPREGVMPKGMEPSKPGEQTRLFPEDPMSHGEMGHTLASYQASQDRAGMNEYHRSRAQKAMEARSERRKAGWKPAF